MGLEARNFRRLPVLSGRDVWGRPAAVEVAVDGALLVVDDGVVVVWRITPEK